MYRYVIVLVAGSSAEVPSMLVAVTLTRILVSAAAVHPRVEVRVVMGTVQVQVAPQEVT